MAVTIDDLKNSLRIDMTYDDDMIQNYIDMASNYVINAVDSGIAVDEISKYKQFDFAVSLLAQAWYLNRAVDMVKIPFQVISMIQQLRGIIK
ncbi:head-tail connector protein [Loigolactobacillus backii]|uniref:head-tail connector protein n=1 Tax=Loigolactobacillus backii TaxID=375175 RepID=UPI000C1C99FE|nr:head-tail connector protein [Loigolactobacillus backii]MDA5388774.1 head-tail connector protein [Loigolactobacillus backii]MDA5391271.1 head-tail connector protein [Loigolactobacillus backii]PIO83790.1 DNA-packaging protein [Loigolactobacillus backii]